MLKIFMIAMKALVTGSTGFIGSHLTEELIKKGYSLTCLVRKSSDLKWLEDRDVRLLEGDCMDRASLVEALKDTDYVFHLAGITKAADEKDFFEVNTRGTENLVEAAAAACPSLKRFVYVSSLAAAGPSEKDAAVTEAMLPRPVSSYGRSKLEGEYAVLERASEIPVTIVRPPAVYGPRDKDFYLLYKILSRGLFPFWGESRYSLVYVEDLVRGIVSAAESENAAGETFFISDDASYSNLEIANAIADSLGKRYMRIPLPKSLMAVAAGAGKLFGENNSIINVDKIRELRHPRWVCDPAKAQSRLGFSSNISMDKGFKWTANWYRIHHWL